MKIVYNIGKSQRTKEKEIKIINNNIQSNIHMIRHNILEKLMKIKNKNIIRKLSYLIIANLFFLSFSKESYITLKIYGKGFQNVFFESHPSDICLDKFTPPDEVKINKVKQSSVRYQYEFYELENTVELIWKESTQIISSAFLFFTCENITEIDLSNYDSSKITSTFRMFRDCISLVSVN